MFLVAKTNTPRGDDMKTLKQLKMLMALHNISHKQLADQLGISAPTLRARMNGGNWGSDEIMILIQVLKIERPQDVFFLDSEDQVA